MVPSSIRLSYKIADYTRTVTTNRAQAGSKFVFDLIWSALLPPAVNGKLVDVGCGRHEWSVSDYEIHRCDMAHSQRPRYKQLVPNERLPYETDEFDVALATEVIEHTENPWFFVRELCRLAKRAVILSTPNTQCEFSRQIFMRHGFFADFTPQLQRKIGHWTPIFDWQLEEMARRAGWRVARTELIGGHFLGISIPNLKMDAVLEKLIGSNNSKKARVVLLLPK
jgi:hypothetical protein